MTQTPDLSIPGGGADELRSLADLSLFLAAYFLEGPDARRHELLSDEGWCREFVEAGLLDSVPSPVVGLDEHQRRFGELLRIPGDRFVPPFEQAYHEGKATVEFSAPAACEQLYRRAGYSRDPFSNVEPDHVGHQLRFLAGLLERRATKLEAGDVDGARVVATWVHGLINDRCWWWRGMAARLRERDLPAQMEVVVALLTGVHNRLVEETAGGAA